MTISKTIITAAAAAVLLAGSTVAAIAQDFVGKWKVEDSKGQPFEITLMEDGSATATQGEGLKGKWEEGRGTVLINWDSGWSTRIVKKGDGYQKLAYDKGVPRDGEPTSTSKAEKAK